MRPIYTKCKRFLLLFIFSCSFISLNAQLPDACGILVTNLGTGIPSGSLINVDLTTGALTNVGPIAPLPSGFIGAGEFINGQLYSLTHDDQLIITDITSGATAIVGNPVPQPGQEWGGLAQHPDGTVYAMASSNASTGLYSIDISSGNATHIGNVPGVFGIFLVIDNVGNAFVGSIAPDGIVPIDLATGATTGPFVPIRDGVGGPIINLNFGQDADFGCLSGTNMLYGTIFDAGVFQTRVGTLDPATGVYTTLQTHPAQISSFAVKKEPVVEEEPIPTMSEWGLLIFGLLVLNLGLIFIRRLALVV